MVMKELPTFCTSTSVMFGTIATKSRGVLDSGGLDRLRREGVPVIGYVLKRLVALARRNDDLLQLVGLRREDRLGGHNGSDSCHHQRRQSSHRSIHKAPYLKLSGCCRRAAAGGLLTFQL